MARLLISDLHLQDERPDITRALFHLLDRFQGQVAALYILGDLFEVWLGDDVLSETAEAVAKRLAAFSATGSAVYIMHGNRDFLLGPKYAQKCGAELLSEPALIELAGERCLLMHGDSLCTDDQLYMEFRAMVRDPEWQQTFLSKPVAERVAFGKKARNQSQEDARDKTYEILDVNQEAVKQVFQDTRVPLLVHGHTHRPARHQVNLEDGSQCERIVLGDWHQQGWYLLADEHSLQLESFEFPSD